MGYSNENSVYRFHANLTHDLDSLANNYLWFSRHLDFNDPFEEFFIKNSINFQSDKLSKTDKYELYKQLYKTTVSPNEITNDLIKLELKGELDNRIESILLETYDYSKKSLQQYLDIAKVCCFTRDDFVKNNFALTNKLMWSHYADGLRGFCIEYDQVSLIRSLKENINTEIGTSEIRYEKLKSFDFAGILLLTFQSINDLGEFTGSDLFIGSLIAMKSEEWSYENELRLVVKGESPNYYNPSAIRSITIGDKMSEQKIKTLLSVLKGNDGIKCEVYKASINPETFEFEREFLCQIGRA